MYKTSDEIVYNYANKLFGIIKNAGDDIDLSKFPNAMRELEEIEPEDVIEVSDEDIIEPLNGDESVPETSHRPWLSPGAGTAQWAATYYPYAYLRGHEPFLGHVRGKGNIEITKQLMDYVVRNAPEKYFEWGLRHRRDDNNIISNAFLPAAKSLVEKDPTKALVLGIYRHYGMQDLLPELWNGVVQNEYKQAAGQKNPAMFPGILHSRMAQLMSAIKEYRPDFYKSNIEGTSFEKLFSRPAKQLKQISSRSEIMRGSPEWLAEEYPQIYLKGRDDPRAGEFVRDNRDPQATAIAMKKLIKDYPEKYFEWGLRQRKDLKKYMVDAAKSLVETKPHQALMSRVYKQGAEIRGFFPVLWKNLIAAENERKKYNPNASLFPGEIFNRMRQLAGEIARKDPIFYMKEIRPTAFATDEFNGWAKHALEAQQKLGD